MTETEVVHLLKRECEKAGSQAEWARRAGLTAAYVSDVVNGHRPPGKSVLDVLGLVKFVSYEYVRDEDHAG